MPRAFYHGRLGNRTIMRGLRSLLALLVVFVALGGYAYFIESERPPASDTPSNEPVFDFDAGEIRTLTVTAENGDVTTLERIDDGWTLTSPVEVPADATVVEGIADVLAALEVMRVVETEATALEPFGLAEPAITVAFTTDASNEPRQLLIGHTTPTGENRYATLGDSPRVFLIGATLESTFNRSTFNLRDKTILSFARDDVDRFELASSEQTVRLEKQDNEWALTAPIESRADFSAVEGLVGRLETGQIRAVAAETAADDVLESYGLSAPRLTVIVGAGSATATLLVGNETPDGTVYARDSSRPQVFTIETALTDDFTKPAGEHRVKDLFRFRPFNATRLVVERDAGRVVFEKGDAPADDPDAVAEEVWRQLEPAEAVFERTAVEDVLAQLSNLRAELFLDSRSDIEGSGPPATLDVRFGQSDVEEVDAVRVWRVGEETYAISGDEPGAAVIDGRAFDEAMDALDALEPVQAADEP